MLSKTVQLFAYILLGLSLYFGFKLFKDIQSVNQFKNHALLINGHIVSYQTLSTQRYRRDISGYETLHADYPIVQYTSSQGEQQISIPTWHGFRKADIGKVVPLLVDPQNPQDVRVNQFWGLWRGVFATGVFSVATLVGALILVKTINLQS